VQHRHKHPEIQKKGRMKLESQQLMHIRIHIRMQPRWLALAVPHSFTDSQRQQ